MISPRLLLIVALRAAGAAADCDEGYGATLFEEGKTCETQVTNLGTFDTVNECAAAGAAFAAEASKTCDYIMWSDQFSDWNAPWGCRCCDGAATKSARYAHARSSATSACPAASSACRATAV